MIRERGSPWRNVQAPGAGTLRDSACSRMSVVGQTVGDLLSFVMVCYGFMQGRVFARLTGLSRLILQLSYPIRFPRF